MRKSSKELTGTANRASHPHQHLLVFLPLDLTLYSTLYLQLQRVLSSSQQIWSTPVFPIPRTATVEYNTLDGLYCQQCILLCF